MAFLDANRYFLGSKSSGLLNKYSLIAAVEANRKSVSTFIFLTPFLIPSLISSIGTPYVSFIFPPN